MKTLEHNHSITDQLFDLACWFKHAIEHMPLAQGVIVMMATGITLGTLAHDQVQLVAQIVRYLSVAIGLVLGIASLYMLSIDRRHPRKHMQFAVMLLLVMNLSYFIPITKEMYMIIHGVSISGLALMLFLISVRHNNHPPVERRKDVRHSPYR